MFTSCNSGSRASNLKALKVILDFVEKEGYLHVFRFCDSDGKTPLELAIESGYSPVVEALLDFSNNLTQHEMTQALHICARYVLDQ